MTLGESERERDEESEGGEGRKDEDARSGAWQICTEVVDIVSPGFSSEMVCGLLPRETECVYARWIERV